MVRYPIGIQTFSEIRNGGYLYVDKTQQIDDKGYAIPWQADGRRVAKVGITFSTTTRTIESWKVRP